MALPPDKLPPPPEISLLPGREPRVTDTGAGSSVTFSGCVLHYPFDDTVTTDTSGNSNTGIIGGSGTTLSTGLINNKLTFSNAGYITFTSVALLGLASASSGFSVCCWFKSTAVDACILSLRDASGNTILDFVVGYNGVDNNHTGLPSTIIRADNGSGLATISAATTVNDGNWHHIAFTRTTGKLLTLYVDGSSSGTPITDTLTSGITPDITRSYIGVESFGGPYALQGSLDDFQIYNRALTSTEITAIYNGGMGIIAYTLPAATGAFTLTGIAAGTLYGRRLSQTTVGVFTFSGINANLIYSGGLVVSNGRGAPVVTVLSGGIPVVDVSSLGPNAGSPVSEAAPGRGTPVTKVLNFGTPVVYI